MRHFTTGSAAVGLLLCFHNNHSILNYHFPPPPFFLFFKLVPPFCFVYSSSFSFPTVFHAGSILGSRAWYKFEHHGRWLWFPLLILE
jgi:hypothetical protein